MPGSPEGPPPPPPEGQTQVPETSPTTHPLPDASHHVLSETEREQALTGTHSTQQNAEVNRREEKAPLPSSSSGGVTHEQLMQLSPEERMEYVSKLPAEKWAETSKQLGVPIPMAGGADEPQLYIADRFGNVRETRAVGSEPSDILAPPEIPPRERGSVFQQALYYYEYYSSINQESLSQTDRPRLERLRNQARADVEHLVVVADQQGVLVDVRKRALDFYKKVKAAKRSERYGGRERQELIDYGRRGGYEELFWNNSTELKQLEGTFRGAARYVWDGILTEIDKEANQEEALPLNPLAALEFQRLQEQRRIDRLKEKKYITHESYYGRYWELTAENKEELIPSILDWVRDQIAEVSDTDVQSANRQIETIRETGVRILENCRVRLNSEELQDIAETDPFFLRAKALVEGVTDVLGYEKVIYKGGEEVATQYSERFASNYIAHHEAIYLENPKVALILHMLSTYKDGTYWLGQDWGVEKTGEGEIADYRRDIEEYIVEYAGTHQLFISEEAFTLDRNPVINGERKDLRYSFDDNIERILLDPGDQIRAQIAARGNTEALRKHDLRVGVSRRNKEELDAEERLGGLTAEQRQEQIRNRILQQMGLKERYSYLANLSTEARRQADQARARGDTAEENRILWKWVQDYNEYRISLRLSRWYPSGWDRVRQNIDRPTKVLDWVLSKEEFEAMFEEVELPQDPTLMNQQITQNKNDARFGFQLARSYQIFNLEDTMLGGMRTRDIDPETGKYRDEGHKVKRIFDIVQQRLEEAIAKEEAALTAAKAARDAAIASGGPVEIKSATDDLRDKIWHSNFLATHALKAIGLVEGKLPVWSYNFLDPSTLEVFTKTLADWDVEVSPGVLISHNNKPAVYEILERGRRALKEAYDEAAEEHMEGRFKVFDESGQQATSFFMAIDDFGESSPMAERPRMVSKGGVAENRKITDTRFELSTSGGVAVPENIFTLGDLGFYPRFVLMGVTDTRSYHGYIKRRNAKEFHDHKFFDVMDPVAFPRSQRAAYNARKYLVGGSLGEGRSTPGALQEPFRQAYKTADVIRSWLYGERNLDTRKMKDTVGYLVILAKWRRGENLSEDEYKNLEVLRQKTFQDFPKLDKPMQDALFESVYTALTNFSEALKAENEVVANRIGRAPRNLAYDNTLKWYAFRRAMRESMTKGLGGVKGFVVRLGYSPEIASELAIRMMETVLQDDFVILRDYERARLAQYGAELLVKGQRDEFFTDALKISGLEQFMREEGYEIIDAQGRKIRKLGEKIPEEVRKTMGQI